MTPKLQEHSQRTCAADMASNAKAARIVDRHEDGISPLIAQSVSAFRRELPSLLKDHYGEWVAYHGDRRLGFNRSKTQLYQECLRQGLKRGEFLVECVEPVVARETELFLKV